MSPATAVSERLRAFLPLKLRKSYRREERLQRRAELKQFDADIKPLLYRLVRYELELPGGFSANRGYWKVPKLSFKICLNTGQVYSLLTGARIANYFDLWCAGKGFPTQRFAEAKRALRAWIDKQRPPSPDEIPAFTEEVEKLDWMFYGLMFGYWATEWKYRGTGRKLWLELEKINGPIRTKRIPDFSSSHQLLRFLRYRLANPSPLFSVEKVSGPRKKEEIWEIRNRAMYCPASERAAFAAAYERAFERGNSVRVVNVV
jgi:hypothetical protein